MAGTGCGLRRSIRGRAIATRAADKKEARRFSSAGFLIVPEYSVTLSQ
jgi:hypothetical protein